MKKTVLTLVFFLTILSVNAQEITKDTTKFWTKKGNISVLFSQAAYNKEWLGGGTSNISGNFGLNYDINFKKGDVVWDNKFILAYGLSKIDGTGTTAKTDDRIDINSLYGKKMSKKWYYSGYFNFKSQMDVGRNRNNEVISHFLSPAFFQFGPGLLYKKDSKLSINFAPAAAKLIVVHDHFTEFGPSFGVLQGDNTRFELGASITVYYKLVAMANVSIENRLNLYSNYLENPQNVDIDYQVNTTMRINKYLSSSLNLHIIYDDNSIQAFQVRELLGVGINCDF